MAIESIYITHVRVSKFLQGEQGDMRTVVEWNIFKNLSPQQDVKKIDNKKSPHTYLVWFQNL